jgi:hypothetical protein
VQTFDTGHRMLPLSLSCFYPPPYHLALVLPSSRLDSRECYKQEARWRPARRWGVMRGTAMFNSFGDTHNAPKARCTACTMQSVEAVCTMRRMHDAMHDAMTPHARWASCKMHNGTQYTMQCDMQFTRALNDQTAIHRRGLVG